MPELKPSPLELMFCTQETSLKTMTTIGQSLCNKVHTFNLRTGTPTAITLEIPALIRFKV